MQLIKRGWTLGKEPERLVPLNQDPVTCYIVRIPFMAGSGMQFVAAIWSEDGLWYVYEHTLGLAIGEGAKTQAAAVANATEKMERYGKEATTQVFKAQKVILADK